MAVPPLITTIIPTYRRPKLLRRAIKSALNQTYPHLQVCV
ncbi:MAG: glycosyltransferase, partial [Nitrospirota bacterium]